MHFVHSHSAYLRHPFTLFRFESTGTARLVRISSMLRKVIATARGNPPETLKGNNDGVLFPMGNAAGIAIVLPRPGGQPL